jgi:ATP-binding cassette subfamily B protein
LPNYADESYTVTPFEFSKNIVLERLGFHYGNDTPIVLTNINLEIKKGSRVGFVGVTGSGKSTLIDIIMGLLPPTQGKFLVDGVEITDLNTQSWQRNISHVPQAIFLTDDSIEANIAFGIPKGKIDYESVVNAARQAQIEDIIESWPDKYQTFVGERGIRLSGGQRQRIGIARALYKKTDVIILDEATSALDSETESRIMETIEKLDKNITVLIIAHRTTTLKNCDQIVELKDGKINNIWNSWDEHNE